MDLTINLSEQNAAILEAQARAARMPAKDYLSTIVARVLDLQRSRNIENLDQHLFQHMAVRRVCAAHNIRVLDDVSLMRELRHAASQ